MVFTSNFFNPGIRDMVKVRISMSAPKGAKYDEFWPDVAPGWFDLLKPYKDGVINDAEYTRKYLKILETNRTKILDNFRELLRKYPERDIVLLCWCKKGNFCHRRLLAAWLKDNAETAEIAEL